METSEVCRTIQNFRRLGKYFEGDQYICALSEEVRREKAVVIEAAQLYLVQGHYIKALDACHLVSCPILEDSDPSKGFTSEICNVGSVALALLTSVIEISRLGKVKTALKVANRVYEVWLDTDLNVIKDKVQYTVSLAERDSFLATIKILRSALQPAGDQTGHQHASVDEHYLLIEFYYWKIRIVAAEQGLLDERVTKNQAVLRLDILRTWAIANGRLREARFLTYFRIDLANNNSEDLTILRDFLPAVQGPVFSIERALTYHDLARCLLRSGIPGQTDEAKVYISNAKEIFKDEGHVYGILDLEDMQISERKTLPLKDILDWKLDCARRYFEQSCFQQGIRCLLFAIPVSTDMGVVFQQTQSIIEQARAKMRLVSAVIQEQGLLINAAAQSLVRATEYGYALNILEEYVGDLPDEISPKILVSLYQSLRGAYANIGNVDKAASCAEQALIASLEEITYTERSDAAFVLGVAKLEQRSKFADGSALMHLCLSNAINFLSGWSTIDQLMGYQEQDEQAFVRSDKWLDVARSSCELHGIKSKKLVELDIAKASRTQDFDLAVKLGLERLRLVREDPTSASFNVAQELINASLAVYQRYCWRSHAATTQGEIEKKGAFMDLIEALKLASQGYELYSASGGSEMIVTALNWMYDLMHHFPPESFRDHLRAVLAEFDKVESFCDAVRRSSTATKGAGSLLEKRGIVSGDKFRKLYSNAIEICIDLGEISGAWLWIQKSKARSLSDIFGSRALIPPFLLEAIKLDQHALDLYEKERAATEAALDDGPFGYLSAKREAESIRTEMRKHTVLSQILDFQEGSFNVDLNEPEINKLMALSGVPPEAVKYVDWFISTTKGQEGKIIRLVRQGGGKTLFQTLDINSRAVENWKHRVFNFPAEAEPPLRREDARGRMRDLAPLIAGLEHMTEEGDMLILSPSGILHGVPLHALMLGKRTLIERNLVIYSSSAALFRHCLIRAASQSSQTFEVDKKGAFLAVYEGSTPEELAEQSEIYAHARGISKTMLPFEVHTGPAVTTTSFESTMQESSWVHYHGHAVFDKQDPLHSSLVLHPDSRESEPLASGENISLLRSENLSVSSIFSMPLLRRAPHFTIIACDSGTQDIAPGDEPLGIVSALLYAGGASVLGVYWPVDSQTARRFTELFYADIHEQIERLTAKASAEQRYIVLNLAVALRSAIIKMMDKTSIDTKAPLHWAGYVLQGSWFHVYPLESNKSDQSPSPRLQEQS